MVGKGYLDRSIIEIENILVFGKLILVQYCRSSDNPYNRTLDRGFFVTNLIWIERLQ
jgi:hypothetical protein